jgi:[ribosomal protein S18]-alanine N-acetyltransferase
VAGVGDLAGVLLLERATAEAPHWGEGEYRAALDDGAAVRRCLMVAEVERRVVGFAVGKVAAGVGELESVAVAAEERRQGVGRALCMAVMRWCQAQGAAAMELEVRAGSVWAIRLYEGLGFVAVGSRRGYYREPVEDALLMQRELRDDGFF